MEETVCLGCARFRIRKGEPNLANVVRQGSRYDGVLRGFGILTPDEAKSNGGIVIVWK